LGKIISPFLKTDSPNEEQKRGFYEVSAKEMYKVRVDKINNMWLKTERRKKRGQ